MDSSCLTKGALWGTCCGVLLGAGDFMWYCMSMMLTGVSYFIQVEFVGVLQLGFFHFLPCHTESGKRVFGNYWSFSSATCQLKRPYIGKGRPTFAEYKAELDNSLGSRGWPTRKLSIELRFMYMISGYRNKWDSRRIDRMWPVVLCI